MKIKTHKDQIRKMVEEIFLEETGNVPSRAVVRICELFKDFETADIEMITLSRRAYQRQLEESKQAGIVMGKQEARIRKQSEIIDHLNTQPKEEVTAEWLYRKNRKRLEDLTEKELKKMGITKTQNIPEEKEDWEEELGKLMSTWGKVLFVNKGRIGAGMQTAMYLKFYHFIKNLLSEREREVLNSMREWVVEYHKDNWDIRDFDAEIAIGKIIDRELSKLTTK